MSQAIRLNGVIIALCICALLGIYGLSQSWTVSARLSLLLHGHPGPKLAPVTRQNIGDAKHARAFVRALVYEENRYVGCIDAYGNFISASSSGSNFDELVGTTSYIFFLALLTLATLLATIADTGCLIKTRRHLLTPLFNKIAASK